MASSEAFDADPQDLGVAVVGFGWMGRVHTQAYSRLRHHYPRSPLTPRLVAVADHVEGRAARAAGQHGFQRFSADWRDLLGDPDIQAVSITTPNFTHREIGAAFAAAGKHIWIEKPVGVTADDARHVAASVSDTGVQATVGFNYRNVPAISAARELITTGGIGDVTHGSVRMLGDYAADPAGAFTWRYELLRAGHGVIGDLASHAVDLIHFLLGDVSELVADGAIFVPQRRSPTSATTGHSRAEDGELVDVENEDWSSAILRLSSGVRVTLEASRVAVGHQNDYGIRIHGTRGAVEWDFRRMGELLVARGDASQDLPFANLFVGPGSGDFAAFQPGGAIAMGFDDLKVIEADTFLRSIRENRPIGATITDALAAARVLDAIAESAASRRWVRLSEAVPAAAAVMR
jgi:predicted dehydrogenase